MVERPAKEREQKLEHGGASAPPNASSPADVGAALRKAFQAAVDEDVPNELLDLLRRLD